MTDVNFGYVNDETVVHGGSPNPAATFPSVSEPPPYQPPCIVQPKIKLVSYTGHVVVAAFAVVIALPFGLVALILAGKHKDVFIFALVTQMSMLRQVCIDTPPRLKKALDKSKQPTDRGYCMDIVFR
jgi:hypothetical protein